jgi:uncharacterized membrane-anchored protein YitT (DUF2179 family)
MKLNIAHQEAYSRGQLLLRLFFGWLYIGIPHFFLLFFIGIWSAILAFATFWVVLFTQKFPRSIFDWQVKYMNWDLRVSAVLTNLVDGYPEFFPSGGSETVDLAVEYPEKVRWWLALLRALFGSVYVGIPHGICLIARGVATGVLMFIAWWAVLFTGSYPERMHGFNVGTFRWVYRISLYLGFFTDEYPRFSGKG